MQIIPELKQYLQPRENCFKDVFIPAFFGRKVKAATRKILSLPARLGGMRFPSVNPFGVPPKCTKFTYIVI